MQNLYTDNATARVVRVIGSRIDGADRITVVLADGSVQYGTSIADFISPRFEEVGNG